MRALIAFIALFTAGCIPPTSDPVAVGEFCYGATDCEGSVLLEREAVGRSRIDFAVQNRQQQEVSIDVLALVPSSDSTEADAGADASVDGGSDAGTDSSTDDVQSRVVTARTLVIAASGTESDRFAATELGTRRNIELAIACESCVVDVEYVFETEPLECRDETDCSSGWLCDPALGRCAECLTSSDCSEEQRCNENGRCDPANVDAGCATADSFPAGTSFAFLLLLAIVAIRRRLPRMAASSTLLAILLWSSTALAAAPGAGFSLGVGPRWVTGDLGPAVQRGIGISLGQELRWDYVGLGVQLNWAAFLTTQDPPPFSRNVQIFDFTAGPRGYLPLGDFEFVLSADYKRIGLAANSLVRLTGPDKGYHAVGGTVGGRWDGLGVETRLDVGVHHMPVLNSQLVMLEFSVALTAGR